MKYTLFSAIFTLIFPVILGAQTASEQDETALTYAQSSFQELQEFFSLPNDSNYPDQLKSNLIWTENAFKNRGFSLKRLETQSVPLLLAERFAKNADKTVLIYLQIDGQPVDSTKWFQDNPYKPALKKLDSIGNWNPIPWESLNGVLDMDWRIFSRSASDARGPVMMFLKAMDAINDMNFQPNYNIKVILDFEEELGSPNLPRAVSDYKSELSADMLVIFDGPRHLSNKPTLSYGARGIATISLEIFGPKKPLHSGNYGNFSPNPAVRLSQLLASFWENDGRVSIEGWYDGITLSDDVISILNKVPDDEEQIKKDFGIATKENIGDNFQEAMQYPALGILGLKAAWVGKERRTIIPASAIAELNIRLVKENDGDRMVNLVKSKIEDQGYFLIEGNPTDDQRMKHERIARFNSEISYAAFRTDLNSDIGKWLRKAMTSAFGHPPIEIRTAGGSIPISPFVSTLNIPAVAVPTVNADNNQHSPNENLRLGNYIDGIKTIIAILKSEL